jgi:hypothetical protein
MPWQNDGPAKTRGTIMVASSNALFTDIVGDMVVSCGFTPAYPVGQAESWLSLTRTQPCIVICDCAAPVEGIHHLISDASAPRIPLVLSDTRMQQRSDEPTLPMPRHVAWLTFPVSLEAFSAMLETLLPTPIETTHDIAMNVAGVRLHAAAIARPVALGPHDRSAPRVSDSALHRPLGDRPSGHDMALLADGADLRAAVATALAATPIYEQSLRRAVWAYVDAERDRGSVLGPVITALTDLADGASIVPISVRQALTRSIVLWGVEEYFGQLTGVASAYADHVAADLPVPATL